MRRLQHRNLVRLIGCSIGEEDDSRFLVYEYVTNQSLDRHLFGNACLIVYHPYIMSCRCVTVFDLMSNVFPFCQLILISLLGSLFSVPCCFIAYCILMYNHVLGDDPSFLHATKNHIYILTCTCRSCIYILLGHLFIVFV